MSLVHGHGGVRGRADGGGVVSGPVGPGEMTGLIRDVVDIALPGTTDPPSGSAFELTAPATGQRFRVTVQEIPAWTPGMEQELEAITRSAA